VRFPVIGVTTYQFNNEQGAPQSALSQAYIRALNRNGAIPVLIPVGIEKEKLTDLLQHLDGVLFTGGGDVHPERYKHEMHPLVDGVDHERDQLELDLLEAVVQHEKPFLGICRGLQMINVALGGTLFEDIADQRPDSISHKYYPDWPRTHLAHPVQVEAQSKLGRILNGSLFPVNSLHHQGIEKLAPDLRATAFAPDGLVEAIELPGHPFALGVQWHPEWLPSDAAMDPLFQAFAETALNRRDF